MYIQHCLIAISIVSIIRCDSVPGITKCKINDSNCIINSGNAYLATMAAGLPQYGVNTLDPLFLKYIQLSTPNLKLIGTDLKVTGLKDSVIKYIQINEEQSKLQIKLLINNEVDGQYEMKGRLLFLPIEGKGLFHVIMRNTEYTIDLDFNKVTGNDQKIHWQVKYRNHSYTLRDKSDVIFENLFNGNNLLAGAAKAVIAANGNKIIEEFGGPLIREIIMAIIKEVNEFFEACPASYFSLD